MMAAIRASQLHQDVTLIEKNSRPGVKLLLSGKGRCNLTNTRDLDSFIERFSSGGPFLRSAFKKFFHLDLMRFFQTRGLKLKVERQLRVFPESDRADSILGVLRKELLKNKIKTFYNVSLKDVILQDKQVKGLLLSDARVMRADKLILATGGASYSFTGSNADGIRIAGNLGHQIVGLRPGLVALNVKQGYPRLLQGLTLKNIRLKFFTEQKQIISEIGELLFTDFGISGPLVLSLSGKIADWLAENKKVSVEIDLKPALAKEQLDARLLREFKLNATKNIKNALKALLPLRLVAVFLRLADIFSEKKCHQVSRPERQRIVALLKALRLDISGCRPLQEAMITRGGVSLKEIDPKTMESRLIKGLYFCGEMIDVDADTGGFNLQAAFSTGYLAGESAALN